jgi:hypothetical protein
VVSFLFLSFFSPLGTLHGTVLSISTMIHSSYTYLKKLSVGEMAICSSVQLMHWWFYFAGAVVEAFVRLHDKGLIYQGRLIYYSCHTTKKERESVCVHDLEQIFVLTVVYFFFNYYIFLFFEDLRIFITYNT